jgi:hypothetical protein
MVIMNRLETAIWSKAINYVAYYVKGEEKIQVIEPMTCIIRLAILAFKPRGTKICIYENTIYIQEPSLLQGPVRWLSGDNRNDLHHLLSPITKALVRYDPQTDESISSIFQFAVKGLNRLKLAYSLSPNQNSSLTSHSIDLYINLIKERLDGNLPDDTDSSESNTNTYNSFTQLWTDDQIKLIHNLFKEANVHKKECDSYLDAIENILSTKVKYAKEILVRNMDAII